MALGGAIHGDDGSSSGGGCTPTPEYDAGTLSASDSPDEKSATSLRGATYIWDDGSYDEGKFVQTTGKGTCVAQADVFIWAEDGEHVEATYDASAGRTHTFRTICEEKPGHKTPPVGDSQHLVTAKLKIQYTVSSPGDAGKRSASCAMSATLPTGKDVKVNYTLKDGSAVTHTRTVGFSATGNVGSTTTTNVGASTGAAGSALQAGVSRANTVGASGTFTYNHTATWTENASSSDSDVIKVRDEKTFLPQCHGFDLTGDEEAELNGSMNLTANDYWFSDPIGYIKAKFYVDTNVVVQSLPNATCGLEDDPSGGGEPGDPNDPGGGQTGGGDPGGPTTPGGTTTSHPTTGSTSTGGETRGTTATTATTEPSARFQVYVEDEAGSDGLVCYLRIDEESRSLVAFSGLATATEVALDGGGESIAFDPAAGVSLPVGAWRIDVPLRAVAAGTALVDMSFEPDFAEFASAAVELVPERFSVQGWALGAHSGVYAQPETIEAFGPEFRIPLEVFGSDPLELGTPSVSYDASIRWSLAPNVQFDEDAGHWYLTLAPEDAARDDVKVSFGRDTVTIPVHFAAGVPDDGKSDAGSDG